MSAYCVFICIVQLACCKAVKNIELHVSEYCVSKWFELICFSYAFPFACRLFKHINI